MGYFELKEYGFGSLIQLIFILMFINDILCEYFRNLNNKSILFETIGLLI
jgi:hypothetical protein